MNSTPSTPATASPRTLFRATLIAFCVASGTLTTCVLPAEYGIDPTGIGRVLGLTQMGKLKMALAEEAASNAAAQASADSVAAAAEARAQTSTPPPAGGSTTPAATGTPLDTGVIARPAPKGR